MRRTREWRVFLACGLVLTALGCANEPTTGLDSRLLPPNTILASVVQDALGFSTVCMEDVVELIDGTNAVPLRCTANDLNLFFTIPSQGTELPLCLPGDALPNLDVEAHFAAGASERFDIGLWVRADNQPIANALRGQCKHWSLVPPEAVEDAASGNPDLAPFFNGDGDSCGDLSQGIESVLPITLSGLTCRDSDNDGLLDIGACVSYDNNSGSDHSCTDPATAPGETRPNTKSKCACGPLGIPVRIAGRIIIQKQTLPDGDPADFTFTGTDADGVFAGLAGTLSDGEQISVNVEAGVYTSTEAALANWTLTSLVCTDPTTNSTVNLATRTATIDVASGETVTCVFTNTKQGSITIVKNAIPDGPQDFAFTGNITGCTSFSLDDDADGTLPSSKVCPVAPATYNVAEGAVSGWVQTSATCSDGSPVTAIVVSAGESVTCTFVNTQNGNIRIVKDANPNDAQDFAFTGNITACTSFSLDDDADATLPSFRDCPVAPATYNVAEGAVGGWAQTSATCSDGSPVTAIVVSPGESVTCTFVNTQGGSITIVKNAIPDGPQDFAFTGNITGCTSFSLDDDADGTLPSSKVCPVAPATYNVAEGAVSGWVQTSATCSDGSPITAIVVSPGESVTCTFVNTKNGKITVVKNTVPDGPQDFAFTGNITGCTSFSLDDDADATLPSTKDCVVAPATYNVAEGAVAGWQQTSATCSDGSPVTAIVVSQGEEITCTFVNTELGTIIIVKDLVPDGPTSFTFSRTKPGGTDLGDNPTPTLTDGQSSSSGKKLTAGTYKVCETNLPVAFGDPTAAGFTLVAEGALLNNFCTNIVLAAGQSVTITFVNTPPPGGGTRTIGYWKNWSSCARGADGDGKQFLKATAPGGVGIQFTLDGNIGAGSFVYPLGLITSLTCEQAVQLLSKNAIDGGKRAGDPIYNMVAQLLGAKLNVNAGAGTCGALTTALADAQTLLLAITPPFDGLGSYKGTLTPAQQTEANRLNGILTSYNEGTLGGGCPSHA